MAVANGNIASESSTQRCRCYKIAGLTETILETNTALSLKDRYVLGDQLGWGQFGIIRVCSDKLTGEVFACKSIAKDRLVTLNDVRSVKLEIEIMTKLSGHPNVVNLKAVYEEQDYVHLVMELCAGGELFHKLEKKGSFKESDARAIFSQLMQVVVYCHDNGIVHRDLKPENILLATKSSSSPIKLADFGLATYIKPGESLRGTVGSPFYIAPEVLSGGYSQAADVWSAGVILYILLSGTPPFWGKTKSRIFESVRLADLRFPSDPWNHISNSAKDLIRGMLCTDPFRRLTARQVLDHSWIKDETPLKEPRQSCEEQLGSSGDSFSASLMARNQDISFGIELAIISDDDGAESPTFTCRSSFSSFLVGPPTPYSAPGGFSFHNNGESNGVSSSVPSMPSFAFCSFSANISSIDAVQTEAATSLGNLVRLSSSSTCCGKESRKLEGNSVEVKVGGGTSGSRMSGKRNRTIGLGEREQLDLMVTESVIRWASCTHLPSATSLRSSLVC